MDRSCTGRTDPVGTSTATAGASGTASALWRTEEVLHEVRKVFKETMDDFLAGKKKQAIAKYTQRTCQERLQSFLDVGLTMSQATAASTELVAQLNGGGRPTEGTQPVPPRSWQPEDIGFFNGKAADLDRWVSKVDQIYNSLDPSAERVRLMEILPSCFVEVAGSWYRLLNREVKKEVGSWPALKRKVQRYFGLGPSESRQRAVARKWEFQKEHIAQYFFDKLSFLRVAYPEYDTTSLATEIKLGLPDDVQPTATSGLSLSPCLDELLAELRRLEPSWRSADIGKRSLGGRTRPVELPYPGSEPIARLRGSRHLADTYNPCRVWVDSSGTRKYRVPDDPAGTVLRLTRSCSDCRKHGNPDAMHFDFEHEYRTTSMGSVRDIPHVFIEGYPGYFEGVTILERDEYAMQTANGNERDSTVRGSPAPGSSQTLSSDGPLRA